MKALLADWRNVALVVAGLLIVWLVVHVATTALNAPSSRVATVGSQVITEKDIIDELKARWGDQVVMQRVREAQIATYAAQQNKTATAAETQQVVDYQDYQANEQGEMLENMLSQNGMTMDDLTRMAKTQVEVVKLIVPEADIAAALKKHANAGVPPYRIPTRYRVRMFAYPTAKLAQDAYALLQKPDGVTEAAKLAQNSATAAQEVPYIPGGERDASFITKALPGVKPGECTKPLPIPDPNMGDARLIVQVVKVIPSAKPALATHGILVGSELMRLDQQVPVEKRKYNLAQQEMNSKISTIDIQFYTTDYKRAHDTVLTQRRENPNVPLTPTGSAPGMPSMPAMPSPAGK